MRDYDSFFAVQGHIIFTYDRGDISLNATGTRNKINRKKAAI